MSAAPATAPASGEAPKGGKKKLIIIIAVVVTLLLAALGGGAMFMMKSKAAQEAAAAAADEEGGDEDEAEGEGGHDGHSKKAGKEKERDPNTPPPVFVPLDPFTVNLADRDADRFAQIGISLQVDDAKVGDQLKSYMPAIRNGILLILAHKTSDELLSPDGKIKLAGEIKREAARAMGYNVPEPVEPASGASAPEGKKKKKKKKKAEPYNPIVQVNYATFIVQ